MMLAAGIVVLLFASSASSAEPHQQELKSGPVSIKVTLAPKAPVIGDTLTLSIEVIAERDVEVLMPEFGTALDRFSIVDFAPRESIDDSGRTISKQTYRLDPPSSGKHAIPPILVEYVDRREGQKEAPDGLDAYEVLTDRIPFEVSSVLPENAQADLKPPLGELKPLPEPVPSRWPWYLAIVIVVAAAIPFLVKAFLAAQRQRRMRSAYDVARSRLQKLLKAPRTDHDQIERFYVGLSFIIRQYIEDRFDMRAPDLTTEEFLSSIGESPDFSGEHQMLLRDFLKQADLVKFARAEPSEDETARTIEKAERFLNETAHDAPLLAVDDSTSESPDRAIEMESGKETSHG